MSALHDLALLPLYLACAHSDRKQCCSCLHRSQWDQWLRLIQSRPSKEPLQKSSAWNSLKCELGRGKAGLFSPVCVVDPLGTSSLSTLDQAVREVEAAQRAARTTQPGSSALQHVIIVLDAGDPPPCSLGKRLEVVDESVPEQAPPSHLQLAQEWQKLRAKWRQPHVLSSPCSVTGESEGRPQPCLLAVVGLSR